jgi:hypothetical protein
MRCDECGAEVAGAETCWERFGAVLAAEADHEELARMHGLIVLTYHLQHPSRTKPWYPAFGAAVMSRIFVDGEQWGDAIAAEVGRPGGFDRDRNRWRQVGPQKAWEAALNERKRASGETMPAWALAGPAAGEATVADIDLHPPRGQAEQVLAWARSVAAGRILAAADPVSNPAPDRRRA